MPVDALVFESCLLSMVSRTESLKYINQETLSILAMWNNMVNVLGLFDDAICKTGRADGVFGQLLFPN